MTLTTKSEITICADYLHVRRMITSDLHYIFKYNNTNDLKKYCIQKWKTTIQYVSMSLIRAAVTQVTS